MIFTDEELKMLAGIPQEKKHELLEFARSLAVETHEANKIAKKPRRKGGWVKGEIWMSDDFNDPMDFVSEDEAKVLEALRTYKKKIIHEVAV